MWGKKGEQMFTFFILESIHIVYKTECLLGFYEIIVQKRVRFEMYWLKGLLTLAKNNCIKKPKPNEIKFW